MKSAQEALKCMKNCSKIELYCEIFDDLGTSLKILFNPPTDGSESSLMAHSKEKSKTVLKIPKTPSRTLQKLRNSSLKLGSRPETKNEFLDKSHDGYTSLCKSSISLVSETVGHNAIAQNDGKSKLYKDILVFNPRDTQESHSDCFYEGSREQAI